MKFYCKHFGRFSPLVGSVDSELLQLWYTHFILVKAFLGSSPSSPTNFQIEGNICETVTHKNRSRRSYRRQPINLYKIRLVYIVANSKENVFYISSKN